MIETVTGGRSKAEKGGKRRKDLFGKPPPKYSILLLRGETTGSSTADKLYAVQINHRAIDADVSLYDS
ncbi:hypothetical protein BHE74_00033959 [Ensete ventricosum]|nr:hypothetical protein BHE74_00033959 [Ensete ventricosum]